MCTPVHPPAQMCARTHEQRRRIVAIGVEMQCSASHLFGGCQTGPVTIIFIFQRFVCVKNNNKNMRDLHVQVQPWALICIHVCVFMCVYVVYPLQHVPVPRFSLFLLFRFDSFWSSLFPHNFIKQYYSLSLSLLLPTVSSFSSARPTICLPFHLLAVHVSNLFSF